jgi:hypothetical protein
MRDSAERALAESPLSICGIPIKNLTMVEDRDKYYKEKHAAAHQALLIALNSMGAAGALAPEQVNNIAALLAMEGVSSDAVLSMLLKPSQQSFIAQQQMPQLNQGGHPRNSGGGNGGYSNSNNQSGIRFSAPQLGQSGSAPAAVPSDFFLQQQLHNYNQQHHNHNQALPPTAPSSGSANSMRSASGPLPSNIGPFGSMMSREGSFSSLSTISDWYSTTSSNRTSLDLGNAGGGFWGTAGGQPSARLSLDAAVQLRQQLMAVTAVSQQQGGGQQQNDAGDFSQAQMLVAQNLARFQQQQHSPPPPAPVGGVMQSAFYQAASAAPMPINSNTNYPSSTNNSGGGGGGLLGVSSPLQGAGSLPLPPIREGQPGPLDIYSAAVWASAQYGGSTLPGRGGGSGNNNNINNLLSTTSSAPAQFVGGVPSPTASNDNVAFQLGELCLSTNSLRGAGGGAGGALGIADSSNSDQDSLRLSSRNASGGNGLVDGGVAPWQAQLENQPRRPSA